MKFIKNEQGAWINIKHIKGFMINPEDDYMLVEAYLDNGQFEDDIADTWGIKRFKTQEEAQKYLDNLIHEIENS